MEEIYKGKVYPSEQVVPEKIVPSREETEDDDISKIEIDVSGFLKENKNAVNAIILVDHFQSIRYRKS